MRNRRKLLVLLVAVMVAGGALLWFASEREPSYEGKYLSEWVAIYAAYAMEPTSSVPHEKQQAVEAIRHIGTNALPCLLSWMDYQPSRLRLMIDTLAERLPDWLRKSWPITSMQRANEEPSRSLLAARSFEALGTLAAPAVPDLIRRIKNPVSRDKADMAMVALAYIGPETTPTLINILSSLEQEPNVWSVECIKIMGTNARPLVPVLVQRLQSSDERIAFLSADMLESFTLDSDLVVPALAKALNDPRFIIQIKATGILGEFGELARPALPALTNALSALDPSVRDNASNAIWKITTAPGTKAPARYAPAQ